MTKAMFTNSNHFYFWKARTLEDQAKFGIIECASKSIAKKQLQEHAYFRIALTPIPSALHEKPLTTQQLLSFLNSLLLMLNAGLPIHEALELMCRENKSVWMTYVCTRLLELLQQGKSLKEALSVLTPLFPPFFLSMVHIVELSGQIREGLRSAYEFYFKQEEHARELKQIMRYPKIVLTAALMLIASVTIFIVPMFQSIYLMFGNELPLLTNILVKLSSYVHSQTLTVVALFAAVTLWFVAPACQRFNPVLALARRLGEALSSREDPYLYSLAMKMQLENGQSVSEATRNAASCLSLRNRTHCELISEKLDAGFSLAEAFQSSRWFPPIFHQLLPSAETAGQLGIGFSQISSYLEQKRNDRFAFWSKFLEPIMMLLLGTLILMVLLAIYLPIFDLGNKIG